ncbi:MAG: ABC transporter ATP-binding protein, partial [Propionibacteriaceae bacterium]
PTIGTVHVAGQCTGTMSLKQRAALRRRSIGYVFQDYNLLPQLTVAQNIAFPLELDGISAATVRNAVAGVMERVGIAELDQRLPSQLSGGQAQRAAIARALIGERSLLLADEPTGALDAQTGMSVIDLLAESVEQGATVLMVTHQPTYAAYADRTIFLRDGRIIDTVGSDDLDQLLTTPETRS